MQIRLLTHSKEETFSLGQSIAKSFSPMDVVLLEGDLGAGKTTFTAGVAKGLGVKEDVISPTFNIMKCYFDGRIPLYHIDAYRLEGQNIEIGLDEYIEGDGVCLIEWPIYIGPLIPEDYLRITIHNLGGDDRELIFESDSPSFEALLQSLAEAAL